MAWHLDNLRFWLNRGVDGFRFDAVAHLVENGKDATRDQPESLALMREAVRVVHRIPNRYVVCEGTREEKRWAATKGCGGAFAIRMAPTSPRRRRATPRRAGAGATTSAARREHGTMASNHDLFAGERLWDQSAATRARTSSPPRLPARAGHALHLLRRGNRHVAAPALQGDPRLRTPMSWSRAAASATASRSGRWPATSPRRTSRRKRARRLAAGAGTARCWRCATHPGAGARRVRGRASTGGWSLRARARAADALVCSTTAQATATDRLPGRRGLRLRCSAPSRPASGARRCAGPRSRALPARSRARAYVCDAP
jgi:hypothetical protein